MAKSHYIICSLNGSWAKALIVEDMSPTTKIVSNKGMEYVIQVSEGIWRN